MKHDLNRNLQWRAKRLYALFPCLVLPLPFAVRVLVCHGWDIRPDSDITFRFSGCSHSDVILCLSLIHISEPTRH